ncbi:MULTISPECIES: hypothetical protein [Haloarcula]|uniref:hypothetical protein n=1 Tax=Haloarcula TaxID=2237 RepID=UPI0023ED46DA|nr:hypothetical protein [Halomicroarcula sp. XH51]
MDKHPRTVVGDISEFVGSTERRRLVVVVGIPIAFVVLLYEQNVLGTTAILFAAVLAVFLYTRPTAQKTIAASAYVTGVLAISLLLLELYWNWSGGSTASLAGIAIDGRWRVVTGILLVGLGLWFRQVEP